MASVWQAPDDIRRQVEKIKDEYYPHLSQASMWVLCTDSRAVRDNRIIATQSKKCTKTEKLSTGCDFKIIIMMETWANLPDDARQIALDEALARCGVKFVPAQVEVNGKQEVVKDEWGRTIYTDEIDYDKEGLPKWKVNQPDAGLYYTLLMRRGSYNEDAENVTRALGGKPLKLPIAAHDADVVQLDVA